MIDEYIELKELKKTYNIIKKLLFDMGNTSLPILVYDPEETITKIQRIMRVYQNARKI